MEVEDYEKSYEEQGLNDIRTMNYQEDDCDICPTKVEGGLEGWRMRITARKKWRNCSTACAFQTTGVPTIPTWLK